MTTPDALRDAEYIADVANIPYDDGDGSFTGNDGATAVSRTKEVQARVKTLFLNRLLRDFDILIYCQLSVLYYMDCSIFHFAIRAIVQLLFFTPRSGTFPEASKNQPYVVAIAISNLSCMLMHYFSVNPAAGEATRGYLHGGLFIDFIGQKGPISRLQLFIVDLTVVILQMIMLCAVLEKEKAKDSLPSNDSSQTSAPDAAEVQDHDAEERGIRRSDEPPTANENDIELQEFQTTVTGGDGSERDHERSGLLSDTADAAEQRGRYRHPRDVFTSGEAVIMEMNVVQLLRDQWHYTPPANFFGVTGASPSRDPASSILRRRINIRIGAPT